MLLSDVHYALAEAPWSDVALCLARSSSGFLVALKNMWAALGEAANTAPTRRTAPAPTCFHRPSCRCCAVWLQGGFLPAFPPPRLLRAGEDQECRCCQGEVSLWQQCLRTRNCSINVPLHNISHRRLGRGEYVPLLLQRRGGNKWEDKRKWPQVVPGEI